jgi:hypothetical protein
LLLLSLLPCFIHYFFASLLLSSFLHCYTLASLHPCFYFALGCFLYFDWYFPPSFLQMLKSIQFNFFFFLVFLVC